MSLLRPGILPLVLAGVLVGSASAAAAEKIDPRLARARLQAKQNAKALVDRDFTTVAKLTYPPLVEKLGGPKKMAKNMAQGYEQMISQGIAYNAIGIKTPEDLVEFPGGLATLIPMGLELAVPDGTLRKMSYLVAVSTDEGRNWTFIDGANLTPDTLKTLVPGIPETFQLPQKQRPTFIKADPSQAPPGAAPAE